MTLFTPPGVATFLNAFLVGASRDGLMGIVHAEIVLSSLATLQN
jgi:hypothetical protein